VGNVDVFVDLRSVHFQALQDEFGLLQRAGHQGKDLGQRHPFNLPRAGTAFAAGHAWEYILEARRPHRLE
jgi:hypothetical protein